MTVGQKVASVTSGAIEDVASLVPFFGTFLADLAEKSRVEAEKKITSSSQQSTSAVRKFSRGGIANKPSIFGEKGPEAAVPLPDGRTIPVTLKANFDKFVTAGKDINDKSLSIASRSGAVMSQYQSMFASITPQIDQMKNIAMASRVTGTDITSTVKSNSEDEKTYRSDLKYLLEAQISKQDQMIKYLQQSVDINNRILSAAA
jgi:hypothetical protein